MTETTARIRWEPTKYGGWTGHVGSLESWAFQIFKTGLGYVGWSLTAQLPGSLGEGCQSDDPDELKAKAERWLAGFVSSLGAIFPDTDGRVTVDRAALGALIGYANGERERADSQFCCSLAEYERSEAEFQAFVAALGIPDTPETSAPRAGEKE